jgi:hypothetical protein
MTLIQDEHLLYLLVRRGEDNHILPPVNQSLNECLSLIEALESLQLGCAQAIVLSQLFLSLDLSQVSHRVSSQGPRVNNYRLIHAPAASVIPCLHLAAIGGRRI